MTWLSLDTGQTMQALGRGAARDGDAATHERHPVTDHALPSCSAHTALKPLNPKP